MTNKLILFPLKTELLLIFSKINSFKLQNKSKNNKGANLNFLEAAKFKKKIKKIKQVI